QLICFWYPESVYCLMARKQHLDVGERFRAKGLSTPAREPDLRAGVFQDGRRWVEHLARLPQDPVRAQAREVLKAIPPFHFAVAFPEVFLRKRSGFDDPGMGTG